MTEITKLIKNIDNIKEINKINELVDAINNVPVLTVDTELNESSVNPVQNAVITSALNNKQDTLTAGTNISISAEGEISAEFPTYTAGNGISISDEGVISSTTSSIEWGNIQGTLSEQSDLFELLNEKQNNLTAGIGISISDEGVISNTQTSAEWGAITGELSEQTDLITLLDEKQNLLTAGSGISISDEGVISNTQITEWGSIIGHLSEQEDLVTALETKQDNLTAGNGITINNNVISANSANLSFIATCPAITAIDGIATWTITHNLNTENILCTLYADSREVSKRILINSANSITLTFQSDENISEGDYKVVILASGSNTLIKNTNYNVVFKGNVNTTDGVISNFSADNYVELPFIFNPTDTWELGIKFLITSEYQNQRIICASQDLKSGIHVSVINNKIVVYLTSNNNSWDIAYALETDPIVTLNKPIWMKLLFTGTQYILSYSFDGINYIQGVVQNSNVAIKSVLPLSFGAGSLNFQPETYLRGSIDLNETYIKMNGGEVWRGTTLSNTLKVNEVKVLETTHSNVYKRGNVLDTDGVISNFSTTNYTILPKALTLGNNFEIGLKFKLNSYDYSAIISSILNRFCVLQCQDLNNTKMVLSFIGYNGTGNDWFELSGITTIQLNTDYYAKLIVKNNQMQLYLSTDGTSYNLENETSYSYSIPETYFNIGNVRMLSNGLTGSVDLNDCYIKINDVIVWKGRETEVAEPTTANLSNITNIAKQNIANISLPSHTYIPITVGTSTTKYIAPADGFFCVKGYQSTNQDSFLSIEESNGIYLQQRGTLIGSYSGMLKPVLKGDIIQFNYSGWNSVAMTFIYAVGAEPETF